MYVYVPVHIKNATFMLYRNASYFLNIELCISYACGTMNAMTQLSPFEADDTVTNLHVALDRFRTEVTHIGAMKWK